MEIVKINLDAIKAHKKAIKANPVKTDNID